MSLTLRGLAALALFCQTAAFGQSDPFVRASLPVPNAELFLVTYDAAGNLYAAGRTNDPAFRITTGAAQSRPGGGNDVVLVRFSATTGAITNTTLLGGNAEDSPSAIHVDATGSIWVVGTTTSGNFPRSEGAFQTTRRAPTTGFVSKLNATLTQLEISTFLGGRTGDRPSGITVDAQGFAYVTGVTESADYPTTDGAYRRNHAPGIIFVTRLNSAGSAVVASTFLGQGSPSGIVVDAQGNLVIAGTTNNAAFPTTPNAIQTSIGTTQPFTYSDGFVARLPIAMTALSYSTFFGGSHNDSITDFALDPDGNVVIAGTTFSRDLRLTISDAAPGDTGTVFVAKLGTAGPGGLLYSRVLRSNNTATATGIEASANGSVNVTGFTSGTHFPTTAGAYHRCIPARAAGPTPFYTRLDRNGGFSYSTLLHDAVIETNQWFATTATGEVIMLGYSLTNPNAGPFGSIGPTLSLLKRLDLTTNAGARIECAVNAATYTPGTVSPGLIVTIFGSGIGPAEGTGGSVEAGRVTTSAGGVRVLFDGVAAPILYARQDQVNAIVPFSLEGKSSTNIVVQYGGASTAPMELQVRSTQPGIFRIGTTEQAVILNEDGSVNSPDNPAARGSYIVFYITGSGQYETAATDGVIMGPDLSKSRLPVSISIQNQRAELLYAGSAPGMVAGALQINARLPESIGPSLRAPIHLTVGTDTIQGSAYISVK